MYEVARHYLGRDIGPNGIEGLQCLFDKLRLPKVDVEKEGLRAISLKPSDKTR
jgi:hypothetical protein